MHPYFEDYWPWYVTAWALYAVSGMLLTWVLFWDRARRRGVTRYRCPKCWYDLRGIKDAITENTCCSECGCSIRSQTDLNRTRRHWRGIVFVVILLFLAHTSRRFPLTKDHSWAVIIPSTALILLPSPDEQSFYQFVGWEWTPTRNQLWRESDRRLQGRKMWFWQEDVLQTRIRWWLKRTTNYGLSDTDRAFAHRLRAERISSSNIYSSLRKFIADFEGLTGIKISIALNHIEDVPDFALVSFVPGDDVTLETMLDRLMWGDDRYRSHYNWAIRDNRIVIMSKDDVDDFTHTMMYDVGDLITIHPEGYEEGVDELGGLIMDWVAPDHWRNLGGDIGRLGAVGDHLVVSTTPGRLHHVELLLALLRDQRDWILDDADIDQLRRTGNLDAISTRRYDIGNLRRAGYDLEFIIDFIAENVDPYHWNIFGGDLGRIQSFHDTLIILTTLAHHDRIDCVLDIVNGRIDSVLVQTILASSGQDAEPIELHLRRYRIGDIAPSDEMILLLVDVIRIAITPDDWYWHGGERAWTRVDNGVIFIVNTKVAHDMIARLLDDLRAKIDAGLDLESAIAELEEEASGKPGG